MFKPTPEQFFNNRGQDRTKPDVAFLKNHFYREGRLTEEQAIWIIERATELLRKEPNVLNVDAPITGASWFFTNPPYSFRLCFPNQKFAVTSMVNMYVLQKECNRITELMLWFGAVRFDEAIWSGRKPFWYTVSLPRRLRWSRIFQHRGTTAFSGR